MSNTKIPHILRRHEPVYAVSHACDCACGAEISGEILGSENALASDGVVQMAPKLHTNTLTQEYRLAFLPPRNEMSNGIAVLNTPAWEMLAHFEQPHPITPHPAAWQAWSKPGIEAALTNLLNLGFLTTPAIPQAAISETPHVLSAWLHTTDRCNLRCDYCYLPHAQVDMSPATGRAAIEAIFRSASAHNYRAVKIKYAGGEPLLRFSFIVELQRYAQSLAQQHGVELDSVILSNGALLTSEMVETMQASGLRLMISLDGLDDAHNTHRRFPDGRGSFEAVARAIDLALANDLAPDISITISRRNAAGLPDVMAWVLERDLPFSLNFYRENAISMVHTNLRMEEDRIISGMLAAYKVIEANLPRRSLLASLADRANLSAPHLHTCSAGRDYLVFDAQGRVAKCQMEMTHPVTDCHDPDPLDAVRNNAIGLQNLKADDKTECQECEWRYWCGGGCPLETYRVAGRYDVKSPNCSIYKALYPEVVRLEGLRLLKYAGDGSMIEP